MLPMKYGVLIEIITPTLNEFKAVDIPSSYGHHWFGLSAFAPMPGLLNIGTSAVPTPRARDAATM